MFPDDLISRSQCLQRVQSSPEPSGEFYLGVDVARMGGDEITFEILEKKGEIYFQRDNIVHTYKLTTETIDTVLKLDEKYGFKQIYIDDGGLGVAVFDQLLLHPQTKGKVVAINNASRALDRDSSRSKKLLKEDLYLNLRHMMERGTIKLLRDSDISMSLKSIICEVSDKTGEVRIYGRYTHIAEGLIRAAWCVRDKRLNLYYERE